MNFLGDEFGHHHPRKRQAQLSLAKAKRLAPFAGQRDSSCDSAICKWISASLKIANWNVEYHLHPAMAGCSVSV
jgi:hypothetical protein